MLLSITFIAIVRGLLGMLTLLAIAWLFSANRRQINWALIGKGLLIQLVLAMLILKVPMIESLFEWLSRAFVKLISFTSFGVEFLFGTFSTKKVEAALQNFVFMVLPTIIFFSALTSLFYYLGVLQRVVYAFAWIMKKAMRLSGAESLAAAGNIFLGQTESPLLIKPYISGMTRSEMMCLMSGGMATIAGGVLASYINFLGGDNPAERLLFAKHLLTASVMSAPAAVVAAKMLVPETEKFNTNMDIPKEKIGTNVLEAIANGTTEGIKLAVNVAGMLLVFIGIIYFFNYIMQDVIGHYTGLNDAIAAHTAYKGFSLQFLIGYTCSPIAWLMGIPSEDIVYVGQLLGEKTIFNEFYAYTTLGSLKQSGVFTSEKSIIMATYMLCGFSNFASIGIQIGGIGSLAPDRKGMLSQLGLRALLGGTIACLMTAVIVGMLL